MDDTTRRMMFDSMVSVIIEASPKLVESLMAIVQSNRQIEARLVSLGTQLDQLAVRDISAAFQILTGLAAVQSTAMKARHLAEAESGFLKYVGLDHQGTMASLPNTYWVGRAYFGLSVVAGLRGEERDAARLLLTVFTISPRDARTNLASGVFDRFFASRCHRAHAAYTAALAEMPRHEAKRQELGRKLVWAKAGHYGMGALAAGAILMANNNFHRMTAERTRKQSMDRSRLDIDRIEREIAALPTPDSLERDREQAIDKECQAAAQELLSDR